MIIRATPPHDDEQRAGVGEGGEAAGGDFGSGSPSNLPSATACRLSVLVFLISASHTFEIAAGTLFIDGFRSKQRWWHKK